MRYFKDLEFLHRQAHAAKRHSSFAGKRVGIYAGTFDPVHAGHIAFALQAMKAARLDSLVFLPERLPREKPGVEHFGHRSAMLQRAIRPYPQFAVMELEDRNFTVRRTLPKLEAAFPKAQLVLLMGSDTALTLPAWPLAERLLTSCELIVGVRAEHQFQDIEQSAQHWPQSPVALTLIESHAAKVSGSEIRESLRRQRPVKGLLASVSQYARKHWLYVSIR